MKGKAAHAHKYGRLQRLDEFELNIGWASVSGPHERHAHAEELRTARPHLAGGVNADREGHVAEVARFNSHARKGSAPRK